MLAGSVKQIPKYKWHWKYILGDELYFTARSKPFTEKGKEKNRAFKHGKNNSQPKSRTETTKTKKKKEKIMEPGWFGLTQLSITNIR